MHRGLATRHHHHHHQAAEWLHGLGRGGFGPASATSNAEYGGWFSQDAYSRPVLPRTRSEATWRNAGTSVPPIVEVTGLVQLLRESDLDGAVRSNSLKSANNTKSGSYYGGSVGAAELPYNIQNNNSSSVQADGKTVEIYDGKTSGLDFLKRHNPNQPSVAFGGRSSFANQFSGSEALTRDAAAQHSYALQTQLLRGQLESDLMQLRKSSTTLDLLPDRAEKTGRPTVPYAKHGVDASENNMSRSVLGTVPLWRNRLSQNRLFTTDSPDRQGRPLVSEGTSYGPCVWSSVASSSDPATHRSERVTYGEAAASRDDTLVNRALLDRQSNSERIGPKLEAATQVDTQSRQKQNLYPILGDEGRQKLGRYDSSTFPEPKNANFTSSSQPRSALVEADNFPSNGARIAQPSINGSSQLDIQHRTNPYSDLATTAAGLNDARCSVISDFAAAVPTKSILKKSRVYSSNVENGVYNRRTDIMSVIRHSAGPASCFNQSNSLGDRPQEHHQKRVTFRFD